MIANSLENRRRHRPSLLGQLSRYLVYILLAIVFLAALYHVAGAYPLATLIFATVIAIAVVGVVLYIWELTIIGWIVDFLSQIGIPKGQAKAVPLEREQVGEITVVNLRNNIATVTDCQVVEEQLKRLIDDEHQCDFVFDFLQAGNVARSFRTVMINTMKAAQKEAERLGKRRRPVVLSHGETFRVFDDRQHAIEEMSKHDGHGWVAVCSVPVGIRAVSEAAE